MTSLVPLLAGLVAISMLMALLELMLSMVSLTYIAKVLPLTALDSVLCWFALM